MIGKCEMTYKRSDIQMYKNVILFDNAESINNAFDMR